MTDQSAERLGQISLAVRNTILSFDFEVNSCIETTRLGLLVLEHYGIPARPQPVRVAVVNRQAYGLMEKRIPAVEWPDSAYSLAVGYRQGDDDPLNWNGHLVAVAREPDQPRRVLDMSADQFDRPGRLSVPGPVSMSVTGLWTPADPLTRILQDGDTIIQYRPFAPSDPIGNAYKVAPAWTRDPQWFADAAAHVIAELDAQ